MAGRLLDEGRSGAVPVKITLKDAYSLNEGKVTVAVQVSPATGTVDDTFAITSATVLPPGFEELVQIATPSRPSFAGWRRTTALSDPFGRGDPFWEGPGTYYFRSKLVNTSNGTRSKAGPPVPLTVAV